MEAATLRQLVESEASQSEVDEKLESEPPPQCA